MQAVTINPLAPFFIVFNAGSGHDDVAATRTIIETLLTEAGREYHVMLVEDASLLPHISAEAIARAKVQGGVVIAAGGDGTINAVAQAVLGSGCPFGVLPQGTFNYFSRTHGIPSDTAEALQVLLSSRAHPVQIGLVNDRVFLVNASLGLYPKLLEEREAYKECYGRSRLVAWCAGIMTLLHEHRPMRIHVEHGDQAYELRTLMIFVSNNRLQLERIGLPEAKAVEQDQLVAIVLKPVASLTLLRLMLRGALGQLADVDHIASFAFRQITVMPASTLLYGRRHIKVAMDGEVSLLTAPLRFRLAPEELLLLKPEVAPGENPHDPDSL
ncbi:MAG: diacylglycerol kinase family protein [Methylobacter sp.]|nr:diacylglycerol kinase family protein [Methylobacter sp.]